MELKDQRRVPFIHEFVYMDFVGEVKHYGFVLGVLCAGCTRPGDSRVSKTME